MSSYSVLKATTGSFFAALFEGIIPATRVSSVLIAIRMIAICQGRMALSVLSPVSALRIKLMGMHNKHVAITPISPAVRPIIIVSALNVWKRLSLLIYLFLWYALERIST